MVQQKRNWKEYNEQLINRGKITVWIDQEVVKSPYEKSLKQGRPKYCDALLVMGLCLKSVYHLSLRSLEGFMSNLFTLLKLDCPIPSYSLYSKRMKTLKLPKLCHKRPTHILIDASGIKIFGEGEWHVKVHGKSKRRHWIKLHVGVDARTQSIVAIETTDSRIADPTMLPSLVDSCPRSVREVTADGAYDGISCRRYLYDRGIDGIIPPPKNGRFRPEPEMNIRNDFLKIKKRLGGGSFGTKMGKKLFFYHRRSLVETAFSRLKRLFGSTFRSRKLENLKVEAQIKCWILNQMAA